MEMEPLQIEKGVEIWDETSLYRIEKVLGSGAFGKVALCRKEDTDELVALKLISEKKYDEAQNEEDAMLYLKRLVPDKDHIVKFFTSFYYREYCCFVYEFLDSSLVDIMKEWSFEPFSVSSIRVIAQQLLVALKALKRIGVTHADIKPDNIMLVDRTASPLQYKLIDFGLATLTKYLTAYDQIQIKAYRAPEVFLGLPRDESVDMWALGCTLAFLFLGGNLFPGKSEYETLRIMFKILGMPDQDCLDKGVRVEDFFVQTEVGTENKWRFKTRQEFEEAVRITVDKCHPSYDKFNSLDDFLTIYPEIDNPSEIEDIKAFIDLLKKMLTINPNDRILPAEALNHCFITMEHLTDRDDAYVRESFAVMTGSQLTGPVSECKNNTSEEESVTNLQQEDSVENHKEEAIPSLYPDTVSLTTVEKTGPEESQQGDSEENHKEEAIPSLYPDTVSLTTVEKTGPEESQQGDSEENYKEEAIPSLYPDVVILTTVDKPASEKSQRDEGRVVDHEEIQLKTEFKEKMPSDRNNDLSTTHTESKDVSRKEETKNTSHGSKETIRPKKKPFRKVRIFFAWLFRRIRSIV